MTTPTSTLSETDHPTTSGVINDSGEPQNTALNPQIEKVQQALEEAEKNLAQAQKDLKAEKEKNKQLTQKIERFKAANIKSTHGKVDCCKRIVLRGVGGVAVAAASVLVYDFYTQYQVWALDNAEDQ